MTAFTFREIEFGSQEYILETELRDRILRRPIGLCLANEDLSSECDDWHIGAFCGEKLAGVLILTKADSDSVRMRQVGVDEAEQGKGVGRQLVTFAEQLARERGISHVHLNARKTAVGFYERLGYHSVGGEFLDVGIPHRRMEKQL